MDDGNDLQARGALRPTSLHGGHFVARSLTARMSVAVEWQGGKNKIRVTNVAVGQAAPVGCEIGGLLRWGKPSVYPRQPHATRSLPQRR